MVSYIMALPAVVPINFNSERRLTGFSFLFCTDHSPSRRGDTMLPLAISGSCSAAPPDPIPALHAPLRRFLAIKGDEPVTKFIPANSKA
jgi:hypothetical protein